MINTKIPTHKVPSGQKVAFGLANLLALKVAMKVKVTDLHALPPGQRMTNLNTDKNVSTNR
jgi:hypothetical protein